MSPRATRSPARAARRAAPTCAQRHGDEARGRGDLPGLEAHHEFACGRDETVQASMGASGAAAGPRFAWLSLFSSPDIAPTVALRPGRLPDEAISLVSRNDARMPRSPRTWSRRKPRVSGAAQQA